jgi:hypothetical protein
LLESSWFVRVSETIIILSESIRSLSLSPISLSLCSLVISLKRMHNKVIRSIKASSVNCLSIFHSVNASIMRLVKIIVTLEIGTIIVWGIYFLLWWNPQIRDSISRLILCIISITFPNSFTSLWLELFLIWGWLLDHNFGFNLWAFGFHLLPYSHPAIDLFALDMTVWLWSLWFIVNIWPFIWFVRGFGPCSCWTWASL